MRQDDLHPQGRDYYTWPVVFDVYPHPAVELSTDDGETWHPTEHVSGGVRALLVGPDAEPPGEPHIVLRRGVNTFIARAVDNPEVPIRDAHAIRCG